MSGVGRGRLLPAHAGSERREHLRQYILACVRDSVLSWADLTSFSAVDNIFKALSSDTRAVLKDLGREGAGKLLRTLGTLAEDVVAGRKPRR